MKLTNLKTIVLLAASAALLSACGTGTVIKDDGTTDEPKWHQWDKVHFDNTKGTFPNLKGIALVKAGMTKDQLYELIGRPQYFNSWRTREWDYLFHFHTPGVGTNDVTTCQYKVLFDKDLYTRSFFWKAVDPEDGYCPPRVRKKRKPVTKTYTLGADALFDFDRSGPQDMNPEGRASLDRLADAVRQFYQLDAITIIGYTDRLGTEAYNLRLSQNRADTVKAYLAERGIPADRITAIGKGKADQVEPCPGLSGKRLRDCLHPNRRVVLVVKGYTMENMSAQQSSDDAQPIPVEGVNPD